MPYVPSKKTDGKSTDREVLDAAVEPAAKDAAAKIAGNLSAIKVYKSFFVGTACFLRDLLVKRGEVRVGILLRTACFFRGLFISERKMRGDTRYLLARAIYEAANSYGYEGAYLGELNYAFTRFIQRVPQIKVELGTWKEELRYWLYAATVEGLTAAHSHTLGWYIGMAGVFTDIKDEYKRRVNPAYEAAQIVKSGDCYNTPYYNRLVEVVDEKGKHVGHVLVDMKRSEETLHKDVLDGHIVLMIAPPKRQ